jgi:SAM-dependent methyltransferase
MDPKDRFSSAADDYAKYRPDYPDDVVRACADYARLKRGARVVDIGCGTGISSRLFARHGYSVTGVEPNAPMLAKAIEAAGGPMYIHGDATHIGLSNACADLITCAQALHWLEMEDCIPEWRRVLKPKGACAAFWNLRRDTGWQAEYEALIERFSSEYVDIQRARDNDNSSGWVKNSKACTDIREHDFNNSQRMDWDALLGRANSSSYVIHGVSDRPGFENALRALFDKHAVGGHVDFQYRTYVLLWRWA